MEKSSIKIAVIGGGASGLLASYEIKKNLGQEADVYLYEANDKVGKKILATGNGKCNLSNEFLENGLYNSAFGAKIAANYPPEAIKSTFLELGVLLKDDSEGRIYPYSQTSNTILDSLYTSCVNNNVNFICNKMIDDIKYQNNKFIIDGNKYDYCIMACGGLASVKYKELISKKLVNLGHKWINDHPSLCSINTYEDTSSLNGIRVKATVRTTDKEFKGEVLFKQHGLSGIAIFEASRYVKEEDIIHLDLLSDYNFEEISKIIDNEDKFNLTFPKMIASNILKRANGNYLEALKIAKDYKFKVKSLSGYENAQIMVGGIDTLDIKDSLESKKINNLYIIGETLNVDGTCGGYNLHFAWASALTASKDIIEKIKKDNK